MTPLTPNDFLLLAGILSSDSLPSGLDARLQTALLQKGAMITLLQDVSEDAIEVLKAAAIHNPDEEIRDMAVACLSHLATTNPYAVTTLYALALFENHPSAIEHIKTRNIPAPSLVDRLLFALQQRDVKSYRAFDPDTALLTRYYLQDCPAEQKPRVWELTAVPGLEHWRSVVSAVTRDSFDSYAELLNNASEFLESERSQAIQELANQAGAGSEPARNALCEFFLRYDDPAARQIALQNGYTPHDMTRRALFLFLTEQWEAYESLDFSHTLLNSIYDSAPQELRRKLLAQSRYTGQISWIQTRPGSPRQRWLKDLSEADWQLILAQLKTSSDLPALWKLAQSAPPVWSASILQDLYAQGFLPSEASDHSGFLHLVEKAATAASQLPEVYLQKHIQNSSDDISVMAISPGGKILAAGGSDQVIHRWLLPQGESIAAPIYGPAPQTRALAFSPDGQYLVCANGDHAIRIIRLDDGRLIKTLEGHTGLIRSLIVHPDGNTLFSASFDGSLRSWRFPHGPELKKIQQSADEIFDAALSSDEQVLLSAGSDRLITAWNPASRVCLRQLSGHAATITALKASTTGQLAVSASRDKTLRVWNISSGKQLQQISSGQQPVTAIALHPGEQYLFSADYAGAVTLWNITTGQPVQRLEEFKRPVTSLQITPDGNHLLCSSSDGKIIQYYLEPFLRAYQPVESARVGQIQSLQNLLNEPALPGSLRAWLTFQIALYQWKERFDIEVAEPQVLQLQDFDIELD